LSVGFLGLLGYWNPHWKVKLQCYPCSLRVADTLIFEDDTEAKHVCKVKTEAIQFLPDEFVAQRHNLIQQDSKTHLYANDCIPRIRYFSFRKEKFMWDDRLVTFRKIHGLDDVTCQQLLDNFNGLSDSKREQM
jgi:hypothetical protein